MSRVIVVGGGLGGLAASIRLAHAKHEVILFDKNHHLGGKMNTIKDQGFLFDTGPTILTMPQVLETLFTSVGRHLNDYVPMLPLDPQWRAFFEDGSILDLWGNRDKMVEEIRRVAPQDEAGYLRFRARCARLHEFSNRYFFWRNVGGIRDIFKPKDWITTAGLDILRDIEPWSTLSQVINRHFKDNHLRQLFEHFIQYVGSSPLQAPALLSVIHHIQLEFGVWYPLGGTNQVAQGLKRLALELGVQFHLGEAVTKIRSVGSKVTGVQVSGQIFSADVIVANSDFVRSHKELLAPTRTQRRIIQSPKRFDPTCSGLVLYFGLDRKYDTLSHHDFFFSKNPHKEFDDIYVKKIPTPDPTLCVCVPSRTDPSVAPPGCENVYVLVHTPPLQKTSHWPTFQKGYRDLIVDKLERMGLKDFRRHIRVEHSMTPEDLKERYFLDQGAIYGMTSHGRLTGTFKPPNRSKDFDNLYFCGGSVNPGPGVPMVLMSGQIAAECVLKDLPSPISQYRPALHEEALS